MSRRQYRYEQLTDWWHGYGRALAVIGLILAAFIYWGRSGLQGPAVAEIATIDGFATRADETGDLPILIVRTRDGQLHQIGVAAGAFRNCRKGDQVRLLKRPHSLVADPAGCLPRPG